MSTEVVVVPESGDDGGDAGVAFAAGVAAAEAAQAGEEAQEATAAAEVAAAEAGAAVSMASDATSTAWAAREDVDQLRAEFGGHLDEIRGMVADLVAGPPAESELTPERVERENGPGPEDGEEGGEEGEAPARSGKYGNPRWFGRR